MKILVTGGCGYIGSHTIIELLKAGHEVVSIDNFSNAYPKVLEGIFEITGKHIKNYAADLCDLQETEKVFQKESNIQGIIHFAAKKYVNESIEKPLAYYRNNVLGLINLLHCVKQFEIKLFVFSSSCSVYGNAINLPVDEAAPLAKAESPYAQTKVIGEQILKDFTANYPLKLSILRYFNPIGGHESGIIGEDAKQESPNLMPRILGTATGKYPDFSIAGKDYPTKDGTCVRDYVHVSDVAEAHVLAIEWISKQTADKVSEIFNLGSGDGVSVLEMIQAFESANDLKLNYNFGKRREGDVVAIYADRTKAKQLLNWEPKHSLEDMMRSSWEWDLKLNKQS